MILLRGFLFSAGLLLMTNLTMAQGYSCQDEETQTEANICALADFQKEDKKLNAVFLRAIALMKITDIELGPKRKGAEKLLRQAHNSWSDFRNKRCEAEGFLFRGGAMEPHIYNSCRAKLTRARNKDLEHLLDGNE